MATEVASVWQSQFVLRWKLQLSWHGNCSFSYMATEGVQRWQMLFLIHGNRRRPVMTIFVVVNYAPCADWASASSLCLWTHLCTTSMAGTWVLPDSTCCTKALHFTPVITRESFCHLFFMFIFHVHSIMCSFFVFALPWLAILASWSWLPVHLSALAPCDCTCHGAPLRVFWS